MRFVLEETSWAWDGSDRDRYIERIEQLLDRLDVAHVRREPFAASSQLLEQKIINDLTLADLLWCADSPLALPHEVRERLAPHLGSLTYWDELREWPALEATIAGEEVELSSVVVAHEKVRAGTATACLPLPGRWQGPCAVHVKDVEQIVHFVVDETTHRNFFRDALEVENADEERLEALAPHAFPDIYFFNGVWSGLRAFEGGYRRVRGGLHRLLEVLDDHGAWVFTDQSGRLSPKDPKPREPQPQPVSNQTIIRRFIGWGFDVAPEKPNVRADEHCRKARERTLGQQVLYCEWHYKFESHVNRAHIYPPVRGSAGKIIVAIFADHLPLP